MQRIVKIQGAKGESERILGKTFGKYIHHYLFLQTVRAGSTSVTRVSLSRKPTFSSVSTLRRRLAGVFGSCCHHHLARRSTAFQGFLPALQVVKQYSKHSVEGVLGYLLIIQGKPPGRTPKCLILEKPSLS